MGLTLAILEGVTVVAAVGGVVCLWGSALLTGWTAATSVVVKAVTIALCCTVSFYYNDLYDLQIVRSFGKFMSRLPQAFGLAFILLAVLYGLLPAAHVSDEAFFVSLLLIIPILLMLRAVAYALMRHRPFMERVLILGASPMAHKIIEAIEARPHLRYTVVGVADDGAGVKGSPFAHPLLGPLEHLDKIVEEVQADRLIVALTERRARLPVRHLLEARLSGLPVEEGVNAYERITGKLAIESLTPSNLIFSNDFKKSRFDLAVGRCMSFVVAVVGLITLAPVLGVIALLIKLESRGPVFFVQDRVGMHARRFRLIKFRTMHLVDTPTSEWACDNTARITRAGKWLRKFRLDELPQFFNVIRGHMNLVGPRPHPVSNFELFVEKIPYYPLRSGVRPGITGWAQVRLGYANNLDEETDKMRYDLYYIKHLSLWFDLRILFDTVKTVLFGLGSQSVDANRAEVAMAANPRTGDLAPLGVTRR